MTIGKEELVNLYHDKGYTLEEIARRYSVTKQSVWQYMVKLGIPRRSNSEAHVGLPSTRKLKLDIEGIRKAYVLEKLSAQKIGLRLGVSKDVILTTLRKANVERRGVSWSWFRRKFNLSE